MPAESSTCPQCNASMPAAMIRCRECGYRRETQPQPPVVSSSDSDVGSGVFRHHTKPMIKASTPALTLDDMLDMADDVSPDAEAPTRGYAVGTSTGSSGSNQAPLNPMNSKSDVSSVESPQQVESDVYDSNDLDSLLNSGSSATLPPLPVAPSPASSDPQPAASPEPAVESASSSSSHQLEEQAPAKPKRRRRERGGQSETKTRTKLDKKIRSVLKKPSSIKLPDENDKQVKIARRQFQKDYKKLQKLIESFDGETGREAVDKVCDAIEELGKHAQPEVVSTLASYLSDSRSVVRETVARALGETHHPDAFEPLAKRLVEASSEDRSAIVQGLGVLGDRRAASILLTLAEEDAQFNFRVTDALTKLGSAIVPKLIEIAEGDSLTSAMISVIALGRLKETKALEVLHTLCESESATIRTHAVEALGKIANSKSIPELIPRLKDQNLGTRINTVIALGQINDERSVKALLSALNDSDDDVKKESIRALGSLGHKGAAKYLARLLDSADDELLIELADALGRLEDASATPRICQLLREPRVIENRTLRLKFIDALRRSKSEESVELLVELLSDPDASIRSRAIDAMAMIKDTSTAVEIEAVLKEDRDDTVRVSAARALGEIGDPESQPVLEEALGDVSQVRVKAVIAMGQLKDIASMPSLTAMLRDPLPEIRYHSAMALANIGDEKSKRPIEALAMDDDPMVSRGAFKALQKLGDERTEKEILKAAKKSGAKKVASASSSSSGGIGELLESFVPYSLLPYIYPDDPKQRYAVWGGAAASIAVLAGLVAFAILYEPPAKVIRRGYSMSVSIAPDSSELVVGRSFGVVELWDAKTYELKKTIEVDLGSVNDVAYPSPGNFWVAFKNQLYRFNKDGEKIALPAAGDSYSGLDMTLDRTQVAAISRDGGVWVYPAEATPETQPTDAVNLGEFSDFSISPDGSMYAICGKRIGFAVYAKGGELVGSVPAKRGQPDVTCVKFLANGVDVAFGTADQVVKLYNTTEKAVTASIPLKLEDQGKPKAIGNLFAISSNTDSVYALLLGRMILVDFVGKTFEEIMIVTGSFEKEIAPDGALVASAGGDENKETYLANLKEKKELATMVEK